MIRFGKCSDLSKFLKISTALLAICSSVTWSLETSSCTSADEFAAPADGHCLPLKNCTAIHSGSNTPKFRLILKALLCDQDDSSVENPKICCPDVKTNLIGQPSEVAQLSEFFTRSDEKGSSKEKEYEDAPENDGEDVTADEYGEFDFKDRNNASAITGPDTMIMVFTTKMPVKGDSLEEIAEGTTTTEPFENVESLGESQEDQVTTTTEGSESDIEKELDFGGNGEIMSEANAVTDTTDYDYRGKMMAMLESTSKHAEYEIGFGPTAL